MARIRRNRGGRKRQAGDRKPSGDLKPQHLGPTEELMRHRAESVGEARAKREESASAVGRLFLCGHIKRGHYEASIKLVEAWDHWRSLASIPSRHPKSASYGDLVISGPRQDCDQEQWVRAKHRFLGAVVAIGQGLRWSAVECVVIDDTAPPRLLGDDHLSWRVRAALLDGLDRLARHFGIDVDERPEVA